MERKERQGTAGQVTVTAEQVRAYLDRAKTTAEEERALRMRYGASVSTTQALPTAHGGNRELADELTLIEMQLMRAVKSRAMARAPAAPRNAAKDKIVRALKTKKK